MSYGLYVEGGNGILQLDSSKNYLEGYAVKEFGTKNTKFTDVNSTDIFFFNFEPPAGTQRGIFFYDSRYSTQESGFPPIPSGNDFYIMSANPSTLAYEQPNVNYVKLRRSKDIGTSTYGTYGLQVFNELGDTIVFDSRAVQKGFTVTQYFASRTVGGDSSSNPYGPAISTNPNAYVSLLHTVRAGVFLNSVIFFSNNHSTYGSKVYSQTTSYSFNYGTSYLKNFTPIILGETF